MQLTLNQKKTARRRKESKNFQFYFSIFNLLSRIKICCFFSFQKVDSVISTNFNINSSSILEKFTEFKSTKRKKYFRGCQFCIRYNQKPPFLISSKSFSAVMALPPCFSHADKFCSSSSKRIVLTRFSRRTIDHLGTP